MTSPTGSYRQLLVRALGLFFVTYIITVGGTLNGVVNPSTRQISLGLLSVLVGIWLWHAWRRPSGFLPHYGVLFVLALWAVAITSSALHHTSIRAWTGVWFAGLYAGAGLLLVDLRSRSLPGPWIIDSALLAAVPVMLFAILQVAPWFVAWFGRGPVEIAFVPPRPPGTLGNPNVLGSVLAIMLPFGLVRTRWARRRPDRVLAGLWCALAAVVLFLTYSRGAWLAAGTGAVVLTLVRSRSSESRTRRLLLTQPVPRLVGARRWMLVGLAVLVMGCGLIVRDSDLFSTPRRETSARLTYFQIAWRTFRDHPLTGVGPFTFGLYQAEARSIPPEQPHAHAHNLILNVAAELGMPGLLALVATWGLFGWRAWATMREPELSESRRAQAAAGIASMAAFSAHALVDVPMIVPAVMLLSIALWLSAWDWHETRAPSRTMRTVYFLGIAGLWVATLWAGWWATRTYVTYIKGERLLVSERYDDAIELLKGAADQQPANPLYWAEYGYACGLAAATKNQEYLQPGIRAYERALALERPHAVWWTNLAALYWQAGDHEAAVEAMRQATQFAPDAPDMWINFGVYLEGSGRYDEVVQAYSTALDRDPAWAVADFWNETAWRQAVFETDHVGSLPFERAQALRRAGRLDEGVRVLTELIARDRSQPKPYVLIARLYLQIGEPMVARDYLAAARLLAHSDLDWAWITVAEAELAIAEGNQADGQGKLAEARARLWPDATGSPLYYGQDIANLQFLSLRVKGTLLPQVIVLGPDPPLISLLRDLDDYSASGQ